MTRPIDADNLSIRKFIIAGTFEPYAKGWNDAIDAIIDNEPTMPLPDFKEGYKQAIRDGKTNFSRPQGKWIKTVMFGEKCLECDQCGKADFNIRHYKFCPDCGAEMEVEDGKTV